MLGEEVIESFNNFCFVCMLLAASASLFVIPVCDYAPVYSESRFQVSTGISRQPVCDSGWCFCSGIDFGYLETAGL